VKILVKQIDLFKSVLNKGVYVPKYIIYLMYENTPISAHIEYGDEAKQKCVSELNKKYQITDNVITNEYLIN
jgi:hypothetical protein